MTRLVRHPNKVTEHWYSRSTSGEQGLTHNWDESIRSKSKEEVPCFVPFRGLV